MGRFVRLLVSYGYMGSFSGRCQNNSTPKFIAVLLDQGARVVILERIELEILTIIGETAVNAQRLCDKRFCIGLFKWLLEKLMRAGLSLEAANWQVYISWL